MFLSFFQYLGMAYLYVHIHHRPYGTLCYNASVSKHFHCINSSLCILVTRNNICYMYLPQYDPFVSSNKHFIPQTSICFVLMNEKFYFKEFKKKKKKKRIKTVQYFRQPIPLNH